MEEDCLPDFSVFDFSFVDDTVPDCGKELECSDAELVSCLEAVENEEIEKETRFPNLSGPDLQQIVSNAESKGSKRHSVVCEVV